MPKETGTTPSHPTEILDGKKRFTGEQKDLKTLLRHREEGKTADDLKIIELADQASTDLLQKYSGNAVNFNVLDRVHFLPKDIFEDIFGLKTEPGGANAVYRKEIQEIAMVKPHSLLRLAEMSFHELIHLKTHHYSENRQGLKEELVGFQTIDPQKGDRGEDLNEMVVHRLNLDFYEQTLKPKPLFKSEVEELETLRKEYQSKAESRADKITAEYILAIEYDNKGEGEILCLDDKEYRLVGFEDLMQKMSAISPQTWPTPESVWEFVKTCYFRADKDELEKAVDTALGKGTFKKVESGEWFLERKF